MRVFVFILLLCMCCSLVGAEPPRWCRGTPCALIHPSFYVYRKCCSQPKSWCPSNACSLPCWSPTYLRCCVSSSVTTPPPPAVAPVFEAHIQSPAALAPSPDADDFKAPWWCKYMPRLPCNTLRLEHGLSSAKCCGTIDQTPPAPSPQLPAPVLHETPCPKNSSSDSSAIFTPDPTMCFEQRITSTKCEVHNQKSENAFQRSIRCCTHTTYIGKECSSPNNMTRTTKTQCTVDGVPVPPVEAQPSPSPVEAQYSPSPVEAQPNSPPSVEAQPSPAPPPSGTPPNSPPPGPPPTSSEGHSDCYPPVIENQAAAIRGMCCITRVVNGADCSGPVRKPYRTVHTDCHPANNSFCFSG